MQDDTTPKMRITERPDPDVVDHLLGDIRERCTRTMTDLVLPIQTASCSCGTKTPDENEHAETCTYRRGAMIDRELRNILSTLDDLYAELNAGIPSTGTYPDPATPDTHIAPTDTHKDAPEMRSVPVDELTPDLRNYIKNT